MKNFGRALRLALRFRWRLLGLFLCAAAVGVLWGANITTLFPLMEISFKGRNPQQWVRGEIADAERRIVGLEVESQELADDGTPEANRKRILLTAQIDAERRGIELNQKLQPFIDQYLPSDAFMMLALVVGLLLAGTIVKSIFYVMHSYLADSIVGLTAYHLRREFYRKTLKMDQARFSADGTSELLSRFTFDMENLSQGLKFLLQMATREPLKMLACFIGAAAICWQLLLFSLIVVPVGALAVGRLSKLLKSANRKAMEGMSRLYAVLEETFQGVAVVKAFTMESYERKRFREASKEYLDKTLRIAQYDALTSPVTEMIGIVTISITLLAGAYLALSGETHLFGIQFTERPLSLGLLITFYGLMAGMSDPGRKLSQSYNRLQRAAAAADRIFAMMDRPYHIADPEKAQTVEVIRDGIEFKNVAFSYDGKTPVLRGVDFKIRRGETIAVLGPNGCGKSTLVQLLLRFYDPQEGRVTIDGVDIKSLRLADLRGRIGVVSQEPVLFQDTVFNNILYGDPSAPAEAVYAAARQAHAHRFIEEKLPQGYDTMLAERGGSLSGGQRQRIALARAILRDPEILVLDEATSQIDVESEQLIHSALESFVRRRTTFIITHRPSTLALADRVMVMHGGEIEAIGTHEEIVRTSDFYRRFQTHELREAA